MADDYATKAERARVEAKANKLLAIHANHEARMDEEAEILGSKPQVKKNICRECFTDLASGRPHRPNCGYNRNK